MQRKWEAGQAVSRVSVLFQKAILCILCFCYVFLHVSVCSACVVQPSSLSCMSCRGKQKVHCQMHCMCMMLLSQIYCNFSQSKQNCHWNAVAVSFSPSLGAISNMCSFPAEEPQHQTGSEKGKNCTGENQLAVFFNAKPVLVILIKEYILSYVCVG